MRNIIASLIILSSLGAGLGLEGQAIDLLIVTGEESSSPDAFAAAESLGKKAPAGIAKHLTLDEKTLQSPAGLSERLAALIKTHRAKALVVHNAQASAAFRNIRQSNPDMVLISVRPIGASLEAEAAASLVLDIDWIGRAVLLARRASQYGIKEILYYSEAEPLGSDARRSFKGLLSTAAADFSMAFVEFPQKENAVVFLESRLEATGGRILLWAGDGKDRALLIQNLAAGGGYFLEQSIPSIRTDFPALLRFTVPADPINYPQLVKAAEKSAIESGAAGKYGVWQYPADWVLVRAAGAIAAEALMKRGRVSDPAFLQDKVAAETGGIKFKLTPRIDPDTGVRARNHFLFIQDLYVLGKGFLPVGRMEIPAKYYRSIKAK